MPPPIDIKGRVVNENGDPVVATVMVKGTVKCGGLRTQTVHLK
ncbi:MAG: hypothetical protein WDO71_08860 [Bacteroidota bacterium]